MYCAGCEGVGVPLSIFWGRFGCAGMCLVTGRGLFECREDIRGGGGLWGESALQEGEVWTKHGAESLVVAGGGVLCIRADAPLFCQPGRCDCFYCVACTL